jgi:hypothetical protein
VAQNRAQLSLLVSTVMNLRVSENVRDFFTSISTIRVSKKTLFLGVSLVSVDFYCNALTSHSDVRNRNAEFRAGQRLWGSRAG